MADPLLPAVPELACDGRRGGPPELGLASSLARCVLRRARRGRCRRIPWHRLAIRRAGGRCHWLASRRSACRPESTGRPRRPIDREARLARAQVKQAGSERLPPGPKGPARQPAIGVQTNGTWSPREFIVKMCRDGPEQGARRQAMPRRARNRPRRSRTCACTGPVRTGLRREEVCREEWAPGWPWRERARPAWPRARHAPRQSWACPAGRLHGRHCTRCICGRQRRRQGESLASRHRPAASSRHACGAQRRARWSIALPGHACRRGAASAQTPRSATRTQPWLLPQSLERAGQASGSRAAMCAGGTCGRGSYRRRGGLCSSKSAPWFLLRAKSCIGPPVRRQRCDSGVIEA